MFWDHQSFKRIIHILNVSWSWTSVLEMNGLNVNLIIIIFLKCSGNFCYRWFLGFLPPKVEYFADSPSYANVKTKDYPDPHLCALTRNCDFDPTLHVEHFLNLWISLIGQVVSMTTFLFSPNNFIWGPQKSPPTPCKSRICEVQPWACQVSSVNRSGPGVGKKAMEDSK